MIIPLLVLGSAVTYTNPGASAVKIVEDLAQISGRKLEAAKVMSKDILVVRLQSADMDEVLAQVAWAVGGSWSQEGETLRLVRTGEDLLAERRREAEITRKDLAEWRQNSLIQIQKLKADDWQRRGLLQLFQSFPMRDLENLPIGVPAVFSDLPTSLQYAFPSLTAKAITTLRADYERKRLSIKTEGEETTPPASWGKMLLTLERSPELPGQLRCSVSFIDRNETAVDGMTLRMGPSAGDSEELLDNFEAAEAKRSARIEELKPKLRYPTRIEPLSVLGGPSIVKIAQKKNLNLIASLHDSDYALAFAELGYREVSDEELLHLVAFSNELIEGSGWLRFRPKQAALAREKRVDRTLLEQYAGEIAQDSDLPLRRACQWKALLPEDSALVPVMEMVLHSSPSGGFYGQEEVYRLIGSFSDAQFGAAMTDGIGMRDLTGSQQEVLRKLLLNLSGELEPKPNQPSGLLNSSLASEPTEFLVGRMDLVRLKIDEIQKPTYLPKAKKDELALDEQGFARLKLQAQDPTRQANSMFDFSSARPATLTGWTVKIDLSPAYQLVKEASATTNIGPPTPYEKLPESFRNKVEEAIKVILEKRKNRKVTPPTHDAPPPR